MTDITKILRELNDETSAKVLKSISFGSHLICDFVIRGDKYEFNRWIQDYTNDHFVKEISFDQGKKKYHIRGISDGFEVPPNILNYAHTNLELSPPNFIALSGYFIDGKEITEIPDIISFSVREDKDRNLPITAVARPPTLLYFLDILLAITIRWPAAKRGVEEFFLRTQRILTGIKSTREEEITDDPRKPDKPQKPSDSSSKQAIYSKFDYYHKMKERGYKYTLGNIAKELGYSESYIRKLHTDYKKDKGIS